MSVLIMLILTSYSCAAYTPRAILYFCNLFSKTNIRWFRRLFFRFSLTVTSQTYILPLDATFSNCFCINFQTWRESSKHFPVDEKISTRSLKLRLHTAINRADSVSWWMWFNGSPTKAHRHFLTNAFCYLRTRIYI